MPAWMQALAYLSGHSWETVTKWSAMTVEFMFLVVTHSGVSCTDGTDVRVCGSVRGQVSRVCGGDTGPDVYGQRRGGLGLQVDGFVDGAALVLGQDVLQSV